MLLKALAAAVVVLIAGAELSLVGAPQASLEEPIEAPSEADWQASQMRFHCNRAHCVWDDTMRLEMPVDALRWRLKALKTRDGQEAERRNVRVDSNL